MGLVAAVVNSGRTTIIMHSGNRYALGHWRERTAGLDERVSFLDGSLGSYINLDNAASTPPFREVVVTSEEVSWAELPDREEAGSPNVIGAVAMAVAAQTLMRIDMDSVTRHEQMLTAHALEQLQ